MCLQVPLPCNHFMTILSIHASTLNSSKESIMAFYHDLRSALTLISYTENISLLGDFNMCVGHDHETWWTIGNHSHDKMNNNGLCLLQLCNEFKIVISNSIFQQKEIHKLTWIHLSSKCSHILDYIVTRKRYFWMFTQSWGVQRAG